MVREWVKAIVVFLICIVIGSAAGLLYGLVIDQVEYTNVDVVDLAQSYKADYLLLIAADYAHNDDLDLARERIQALGFKPQGVRLQAEQFVFEERAAALALARLALDMGLDSDQLAEALLTPTPRPTATPSPEPEPSPSPVTVTPAATPDSIITPTATVTVDYMVRDVRILPRQEDGSCGETSLVFVTVRDAEGELVDGVTVAMRGEDGEYRQVTGFNPEAPGRVAFPLEGRYILEVVEENEEPVESEQSREITDRSPATDDLVAAGYCDNAADCERKRNEDPAALCDGRYSWELLFQRTDR